MRSHGRPSLRSRIVPRIVSKSEFGRAARLSFSLSFSRSLSRYTHTYTLSLFLAPLAPSYCLSNDGWPGLPFRGAMEKRDGRVLSAENAAPRAERTFLFCDKMALGFPPRSRPPPRRRCARNIRADLRSTRARTEIRVVQRKLAIAQCCHRRCC